ncbi:immunoglobulin lambda-1 light chain-like isoform X1 [Ambystoma mexicanum]|uniref:immunoglobulin lambda-1 light chain-like isoform X1 n=1 Tax=Ambystoma mexicanum TaxID=8296 RepID=UPI0037E7B533
MRMSLLATWLLCALLCVSYARAQAPVMPPSAQVNLGQRVSLSCDVGVKEQHVVSFHRQIPGEAPKLILSHHHSYSSPTYGPGMSSPHFTASVDSAGTKYQLIIQDAEIADTAHYQCAKWFNSVNGYVFSQPSKLTVTGANYPEPEIVLFSPQPEVASGSIQPTLTCHISNLSVPFGTVNWLVDRKMVQGAVTGEPARDLGSNTFSMSSYLTMADIKRDSQVTCQIQQDGSTSITARSIKLSECS